MALTGTSSTRALRPAVFLDRDGVLIRDDGYIGSIERVVVLPGVAEALARLMRLGYALVVVSNQSGVARGMFTEADVAAVHAHLAGIFARQGIAIERFYYCPHHPSSGDERYRCDCRCRKPAPGMIEQAILDLGLDVTRSIMVGDKASDMEAGRAAGVGVRVLIGAEHEAGPATERFASLLDLARALESGAVNLRGTAVA